MTRTETDLHAVLTDRASQATSGAAVLDWLDSRPVAQPRTRHRLVVPLAAVAATVVITLVAVWLQRTSATEPTSTSAFNGGISANTIEPTNKAFYTYTFSLDHVAGFPVESRRVQLSRQTIVYSQGRLPGAIAGTPDVLEAVVYRKGAFDPTTVRTGTALTVNGAPGYYGPVSAHVHLPAGPDTTAVVAAVAWRYAPDSWAVVHGVQAGFRDKDHELAVARAVHPGTGSVLRLAFQVGYLPTGLRATRVDSDDMPSSQVDFARSTSGSTVHISADYDPDQSVRAGFGSDPAPLTVGGFPAKLETLSEGSRIDGHVLEIFRAKYWVTVSGDTSITTKELKAIAVGLTLARNGGDPNTWISARTALPH